MNETPARDVKQVVQHLSADFPEIPEAELTEVVAGGFQDFAGAPVRDYLPVLVGRRVRQRLQRPATS